MIFLFWNIYRHRHFVNISIDILVKLRPRHFYISTSNGRKFLDTETCLLFRATWRNEFWSKDIVVNLYFKPTFIYKFTLWEVIKKNGESNFH